MSQDNDYNFANLIEDAAAEYASGGLPDPILVGFAKTIFVMTEQNPGPAAEAILNMLSLSLGKALDKRGIHT